MADRTPLDSAAQDFLRPPPSDSVEGGLGVGITLSSEALRRRLERPESRSRERLTVDLDAKLSDRLRIACAHLGCSKSDFAREVIEQALRTLGY